MFDKIKWNTKGHNLTSNSETTLVSYIKLVSHWNEVNEAMSEDSLDNRATNEHKWRRDPGTTVNFNQH